MNKIIDKTYRSFIIHPEDNKLAKIGHVNAVIDAMNNLTPGSTIMTKGQFASQSLTIAATTTINCGSNYFQNFYSSSSLTATTIAFSNFPDGSTITWDYLKTTASDLVMTFPAGSIVSINGSAAVSGGGLIATLSSTSSGRFTINIVNINSVYKVFIVNDIA